MRTTLYRPEETAEALEDAARRFVELIPMISDPSATTPHVPDWTADGIVRHCAYLPGYWLDITKQAERVASTPTELGKVNAENMASIEGVPLAECSDRIRNGIGELAELVRTASHEATRFPFHAGSEVNVVELGAIGIAEYEIHGIDLASAIGRKWTVPARHAAISLCLSVPGAAANWVDRRAAAGHSGTYEIRFRKGLGTLRMRFDDGELDAEPSGTWKPEATISADASAFLRLFYGRQSQWSAIAKGEMISWGRKPWKPLGLKSKFLSI